MIPPDIPLELLTKSVPELVNLLAAGKISVDFVGWARQKVRDAFNKKQYGFTPDPQTAKSLQKVSNSDAYKRMRHCIGSSSYLSVVRIGLRIEELSSNADSTTIANIKDRVYKKYGHDGITILKMGSAGILMPLIQHLSDVKIENNYSQEQTLNRFIELIHNWSAITIYHKSENGKDDLIQKVNRHMNAHDEVFFVFAIGKAGHQAKLAISFLNTSGTIQKKGYMFKLILRGTDGKERDHFAWFFRNIYTFDKTVL